MKKLWGSSDQGDIYRYDISNGRLKAVFMNYGANLLELYIPAVDGPRDVVLGYKDLTSYFDNEPCFGCAVTPYANRIKNASFTFEGRLYKLDSNDNNNCLHSGFHPLHKRIWDVTSWLDNSITFSIEKNDMDMGFPGNLKIKITYTLTDDDMLRIDYDALSDKDTVFNPTNHSYFNLSGFNAGHDKLLSSLLTIDADFFTPTDDELIPTGEIRSVDNTPLDFRTPKALFQHISDFDYEPIRFSNGFDHNFIINNYDGTFRKAAVLHDPSSNSTMEVYTDMPGIQIYSGNYLKPAPLGKKCTSFQPHDGIALETQFFPNAVNIPSFPQPIIKAGVAFHSSTGYKFVDSGI
ncbi:MAG: galactose mutarotase [Lachnospiraceae bacterium]|nr:galactose mutarotase [Lachnospiraceae bacterium]